MKKLASVLAAILIAAAMSVTAFAEESTGFVSSIEQQPAPTVDSSTTVTINGEEIDVDNLDDSGLRLVITPLAKADDAPNDEITDMLETAYQDIAKDIEFSSDEEQAEFQAAQDDAASRGKTLVASNIFDISVLDDSNLLVDVDGIHITLEVSNADDLVLVMHKADGGWEVIDFTNNGDGTISFVLSSLSPMAFFVEADAPVVSNPSDTDEEPSDEPSDEPADDGEGEEPSDDKEETPSDSKDETPSDSKSETPSTTTTPSSSDSNSGNKGTSTSATPATSTEKVTSPNTGAASENGIALVSAIVLTAGAAVCVVKSKKH
jgi:hypothetical protein